jgi:hypothetical protein
MNRLFMYAVILNAALLGVFILLDMITWNAVAVGLASLIQAIRQGNGTLTSLIWSDYSIIQVGISVGYFPNIPYFAYAVDTVNAVNLALIWFIVTIAVNLSLIWHSETQRVSKQTRDSKTEIISAQQ